MDHKNPFPTRNARVCLVLANVITYRIYSVRKKDDYTRGKASRNPIILTPGTLGISWQPEHTCIPVWKGGMQWREHYVTCWCLQRWMAQFPMNSLNQKEWLWKLSLKKLPDCSSVRPTCGPCSCFVFHWVFQASLGLSQGVLSAVIRGTDELQTVAVDTSYPHFSGFFICSAVSEYCCEELANT